MTSPILAPSFAWKLIKISLITLLCSILALCLAGTFILGSEPGRLWLTQQLINKLNDSEVLQIKADQLSMPRFGHWQADNIVVRRNDQLWLEIQQFELHWQPVALLDKDLMIESLSATTLNIHKLLPQEKASRQQGLALFSDIQQHDTRQYGFLLRNLSVSQLNLLGFMPDNDVPQLQSYSARGDASWLKNSPLTVNLDAQSLNDIPAHLSIMSSTDNLKTVTIEGSLQEQPGGVIATLLQLPESQTITAGFKVKVATEEQPALIEIESLHFPLADHQLSATARLHVGGGLQSANTPNSGAVNFDISKLELTIDGTTHHVAGSRINNEWNIDLDTSQFPLDLLAPWIPVLTTGEVSGKLHIGGTTSEPTIAGELAATTTVNNAPLSAHWRGSASTSEIELSELRVIQGETRVNATGRVDLAGATSNLSVQLSNLDLSQFNDGPLKPFNLHLPQQLQARITSADATLRGSIRQPQGEVSFSSTGQYRQQDFTLTGQLATSGDAIVVRHSALNTLGGETRIAGTINAQSLQSDLDIEMISTPLSALALFNISLPNDLNATVDARLSMKGALSQPGLQGDVIVGGHYQNIPINLNATGEYQSNRIKLEKVVLQAFNENVFTASGQYQPQSFDFQLHAERLPSELLSSLGWQLQPGAFNASVRAKGSLTQPLISGKLLYETTLSGVNFEGGDERAAFSWQLVASTEAATLNLASAFKRNDSTNGELSVQLPLQPYIDRLQKAVSHESTFPLQAAVRGSLDLHTLSFLLDPDLHRLNGNVTVDLNLGGNLSKPIVNGSVGVADGAYINTVTGTTVADINCAISTAQVRFHIDSCQASDGHSGRYNLQGDVQLPADATAGIVNLKLTADNAGILRRPDIESEASGQLTLDGNFKTLLASGHLEVSPFTALLDSALNNSTDTIDVEEIYADQPPPEATLSEKFNLPTVRLDLLISADQQAYLRGRGLEAELQGKIVIRGTLQNPSYDGEFRTVRGVFEVFGKKFKLEQGKVSFANDAIAIFIPGIYKKNGQQIRAELAGSNGDFRLSLSAIPAMAQDEILAFVIFGKSLQKITPFEAVQLAAAVQKLRNGDSGFFDPVGATRDILRVDTLSLDTEQTENGESGLNVGVGKYINEKVYIELERTPNPSQPWRGNVQVELAPNLSVESSTGGETGIEGVELKWKKDY